MKSLYTSIAVLAFSVSVFSHERKTLYQKINAYR